MECFIIGRKNTIASNGHAYIGEPFIVFMHEDEAVAACDLVEKISGERPMMVPASRHRSPAEVS